MKILVSACLLGVKCRYDGRDNFFHKLSALKEKHTLIPVCPEIMGGLPTPRAPSEVQDGRVISNAGDDVTENFRRGAMEALRLAEFFGCGCAVLKERSPSCGLGSIYDGTFSKTLVPGSGVTAALLTENGITVYGESEIDKLL